MFFCCFYAVLGALIFRFPPNDVVRVLVLSCLLDCVKFKVKHAVRNFSIVFLKVHSSKTGSVGTFMGPGPSWCDDHS